jgi:large subunit ribosomal protein L9
MDIILIQDVDNLGGKNELVKVRNGYARNFLIPQGLAVEASASNKKQLDERLKVARKRRSDAGADQQRNQQVARGTCKGWC